LQAFAEQRLLEELEALGLLTAARRHVASLGFMGCMGSMG